MKKIALVLLVVVVIASMSTLLFACSKIAGKSYVLDSVVVTSDGASEESIAEVKASTENAYKDAVITFNKDGSYVVMKGETEMQKGYYKQDGKNIFVSDTEDVKTDGDPDLVVEGKNLVWTRTISIMKVYTIKLTLAQKK